VKKLLKRFISFVLLDRIIWSGPAGGVYVTFDDGPHEANTANILNSLNGMQCPATFFLLGENVLANRNLVKTIASAGHIVGNHGMSHGRRRQHNVISYVKEALHCQRLLDECIGRRLSKKLFRPPYGEIRFLDAVILVSLGYRIIMWSEDSRDSFIVKEDEFLSQFHTKEFGLGDILLFHEDSEMTTRLLPEIIRVLTTRGVEFSKF
jgi:peptidoglycan/xylan/chitin deacetylase (PgdA/CDA1 family)